jgi:diaminopimelate decarboxylase
MIRSPFRNIRGKLYVERVSTLKLAEEFDTPLYVTSESKIRENYRRLVSAFSRRYNRFRIFYSAKANTSLSILKILKNEGSGADTVSLGEVFLALEAGFLSSNVLYTGTCARDDELQYLLRKKVMINVDSLSQLQRLLEMGTPPVISVRVNPGLGAGHHKRVVTGGKTTKFGVHEEAALKAYELAKVAGVKRFGIHMHIGSGVMDARQFTLAMDRLLAVAGNVHRKVGIDFDFVDFGGGIGVPYRPDEREVDLGLFADKLVGVFKEEITLGAILGTIIAVLGVALIFLL